MVGIRHFYYLLTFTSALTSLNSFSFCHGGRHYSLCQCHLPSCVLCSFLKAIWGHSRTVGGTSSSMLLTLIPDTLVHKSILGNIVPTSESFSLEKSLRRVLVSKFVVFTLYYIPSSHSVQFSSVI